MKRVMTNGAALAAAALLTLPNAFYGQHVPDGRGVQGPDPAFTEPAFPEPGPHDWRFYTESRSVSAEQIQRHAEEVRDPAFDVFVSPAFLSQAFMRQDPEMLTDVALQIAEGERVLMRSRKGITAEQALHLAVSLAIDKHAGQALQRLGKWASAIQHDKLAARIAEAEKLAAATRGEDAFLIPVDAVSPEQYRILHESLQALRIAKMCGDSQAIDEIAKSLANVPACCEPHLKKMLDDARSAARHGAIVDPSVRVFFARLAALSRVPVDSDGGTTPTTPPPREDMPSDEAVEVSGTY